MPVFEAKNLTVEDDGEILLAMVLFPTREAQAEARERGRMRMERASMLAERAPVVRGTTLVALTPLDIAPVN